MTQKNLRAFTISGGGAVIQNAPSGRTHEQKPVLLRHRLTSPEKRTLKRIEALRATLPEHAASTAVAIANHLRADRGLQGAVQESDIHTMVAELINTNQTMLAAATIISNHLRGAGALQRAAFGTEDVKRAMVVLSDAIYAPHGEHDLLPRSVREVELERRDGGVQLKVTLRQHADQTVALAAMRRVLRLHNLPAVDIRLV
jgi:hypothetical protein